MKKLYPNLFLLLFPYYVSLFLLTATKTTNALYADEAGQNDFTIQTAGHGSGAVTNVHVSSTKKSLLSFSEGDCYLSSRDMNDGGIQWRRNVCSSSAITTATTMYPNNKGIVYTLEQKGYLRAWNDMNGSLLWELPTNRQSKQTVRIQEYNDDKLILIQDGRVTLVNSNNNNQELEEMMNAETMLNTVGIESNNNDDTALILGIIDTDSIAKVVAGWVHKEDNEEETTTSLSQMVLCTMTMTTCDSISNNNDYYDTPILVSSIAIDDELVMAKINKNTIILYNSKTDQVEDENDLSQLPVHHSLRLLAQTKKYGGTSDGVVISCSNRALTLNTNNDSIQMNLLTNDDPRKTTSTTEYKLKKGEEMQNTLLVQECSSENDDSATIIVTTYSGATHMLTVDWKKSGVLSVTEHWMAEEALASISSATLLDSTVVDNDNNSKEEDEEDNIVERLSFTSRLTNQINGLQEFALGGFMDRLSSLILRDESGNETGPSSKDYSFGLAKIAVMLSNSFGKVLGIDTASKGKVIWTLTLNRKAVWHKIVHGAAITRSSVFGQGMNHPHSPEILILSHFQNGQVEWHCVDGVRGRVLSTDMTSTSSPVVQVVPIHSHSHGDSGCRQNAVLVHKNGSVSLVPNTVQSFSEVSKMIFSGLHTHQLEKENGLLRSMKIVPDKNNDQPYLGKVMTIGETVFDPNLEKIVNVVYPQRNEVVQSPTTIVGDDSLLLKYLNPHLCVIVTEATSTLISQLDADKEENEPNSFYEALGGGVTDGGGSSSSKTKPKTKPLGATKPGEEVPPPTEQNVPKVNTSHPTLFINLVDTVSGQTLYRVSHSHTDPGILSSGEEGFKKNFPVVISENWVVYAFPNYKTRRTEVGVLTLHEGLIDKHGITAFSSPEQELTFSSMSSPKPIVFTKTFGVAKSVSAIGVTNTRGGISAKNIVLATGVSGQIVKIDRRLFDPRRPSGVPKVTEKKEGLIQFVPLLPISPLMTPSYSNNVADVTSIISSAANLESQTLLLAYGGPDIFFTRFAPSKGFDSLPESFNKLFLMLLLLALFIALLKVKHMVEEKSFKFGWS